MPLAAAPDADEFIRPCLPLTARLLRETIALRFGGADGPAAAPRLGYWEADLHAAVALANGSSDIVEAALAAPGRGDVNAVDARGRTPLHWVACRGAPSTDRGRHAAISALLAAGADAAAHDADGHSPLAYALTDPSFLFQDAASVIRLLCRAAGAGGVRAALGPGGVMALHVATVRGDAEWVRECLEAGLPYDVAASGALRTLWLSARSSRVLAESTRAWPATRSRWKPPRNPSTVELPATFHAAVAVTQLLLDAPASLHPPSPLPLGDAPAPVVAIALLCSAAPPTIADALSGGSSVHVSDADVAAAAAAMTALPAVLRLAAAALGRGEPDGGFTVSRAYSLAPSPLADLPYRE